MIDMHDDPDYLVAVDCDVKTGRMGGEQAVTKQIILGLADFVG